MPYAQAPTQAFFEVVEQGSYAVVVECLLRLRYVVVGNGFGAAEQDDGVMELLSMSANIRVYTPGARHKKAPLLG